MGTWACALDTILKDDALDLGPAVVEPSRIVSQLQTWVQDGTQAGSLWEQIGVTLEEALLGFVVGVAAGIVCGIALGRIQLLADIFSPYIKVMNSIPRIALG